MRLQQSPPGQGTRLLQAKPLLRFSLKQLKRTLASISSAFHLWFFPNSIHGERGRERGIWGCCRCKVSGNPSSPEGKAEGGGGLTSGRRHKICKTISVLYSLLYAGRALFSPISLFIVLQILCLLPEVRAAEGHGGGGLQGSSGIQIRPPLDTLISPSSAS